MSNKQLIEHIKRMNELQYKIRWIENDIQRKQDELLKTTDESKQVKVDILAELNRCDLFCDRNLGWENRILAFLNDMVNELGIGDD